MNSFQCICGIMIGFRGEVDNLACPMCGTQWTQTSATLVDGTRYLIEENGRWVLQNTKAEAEGVGIKSMPIVSVPKVWGN